MAGDKTYITDSQGKLHRATRVHAVTPTDIVWSSNPNDYTVQVKIDGKWHRAVLTMDAGTSTFFDNINIDKALVTGADGKQHTALIVKPESTVTLSDIKTDTHGTIAGTTTGETAVSTYSENWSDVKWQDNVNVYKVLVTGSDGKVHTALLTTSSGGGGGVQVIVLGPSPLNLPDAIANSLSYVKAFGGTEQRDIPDNYLQRQFIYMMDGSYIKVEDLLISAGYRVEFEFQTLTLGSPLRNYIGGRANGVSAGGGFRLSKLADGGTTLNRVVLYGFESGTEYYDPTTQFQANTRYKYTYNNGVCTLESGGSVISTRTFTVTDTTSTKWGINSYVSGNDYWQTDTSGIYVYSVKVWNDQGELVMDLVPAVQKGQTMVVGFYDRVTGGFRTPSAGTFAAGPEAAPTPDKPMDIVSNNGVLTFTPNLLDMASENIVLGKYINNSGVVTDSGPNFYNSKYIPVSAGQTYTWSTSSSIGYFSVMEYDSNYVFKKRTLFSNAGTSGSITLRSDTAFVLIGSNMDGTDITIDKVVAVDWQFEKGSSATAYKPYSPTGIYTDGTVETINVHGKNLFDENNVILGYFYNDSGTYTSNNVTYTSGKIPMNAGTTVTFSRGLAVAGVYLRIHAFDSNDNWVGLVAKSSASTDLSCTGTTPVNTSYIRVCGAKKAAPSTEIDHECQVELGSTATAYVPYYDGGTATAEMLLKVGDYQDEQEILSGAITRKVGVKVLDGTENWTWAGSSAWRARLNISTVETATTSMPALLCNMFTAFSWSGVSATTPLISINSTGTTINFTVGWDANITSLAAWQQWLADQYAAGTPVIVIYPLATPTTESVAGQTLQVQDGDNTLEITQASLSGLELEAEYTKVA